MHQGYNPKYTMIIGIKNKDIGATMIWKLE